MKNFNLFCYLSCLIISVNLFGKPTVTVMPIDETTNTITVTFDVKPGEFIYKDYLDVSIDHPDISVSTWQTDNEAINQYDQTFKDTKAVYKEPITLTVQTTKKRPGIPNAFMHIAYYKNTNKGIIEDVIPLSFSSSESNAEKTELAYAVEAQNIEIKPELEQPEKRSSPHQQNKKSLSAYLEDIVQSTESLWVRLLIVFLLGILLSLTPCIYPMIPITVGILQSRGNHSILNNFLMSLAYVAGIATTFSILGLLAAFTGQLFGTIMANPIVIVIIVALLIYLAFSMFGLYEMYIPRSLQSNKSSLRHGSFISAFFFGAVSGSVASPCLSPGLVLLLSIVTTLGSKFIGFILLFFFGLGLGVPLLLIGTFSHSINVLPRAGMWMVEIKKLFGILLLGMCFYFVKPLLPLHLLLWLLAAFLLIIGSWYLYDISKTRSHIWRGIKTVLGMGFVASSVYVAAQAYKYKHYMPDEQDFWYTNYDEAVAEAKEENKKLFIDIGAPFCSICKAIDNTIFKDKMVLEVLQEFIPVKINGADSSDQACNHIKQTCTVLGFPTILVIDPHTGTLIRRWGGELYERKPESFAHELKEILELD